MKTKISLLTLITSIVTVPFIFVLNLIKKDKKTRMLFNFGVLSGITALFYLSFANDDKDVKQEEIAKDKIENEEDLIIDSVREQEVYLTKTGSKFHKAGCRHLGGSNLKTTRKLALEDGMTPCGVCKP